MKNILLYICILFTVIACDSNEKEGIIPPEISNVRSETLPGQIKLKWDMPADASGIKYVEVSYYDHRLKKNVINLSSCDTLKIDKTRKKYGDYEFKLTPYSKTQTAGKTVNFKTISGAAPIKTTIVGEEKMSFTEDQLYANNQSGDAYGPINMFDGNTSTIYHSVWKGSPKIQDAYIDFDFGKEIQAFKINWLGRITKTEGKVVDLDLMGSNDDGKTWFLIKNLTKEKDDLPVTKADWYRSPMIVSDKPFSKLRYMVKKTNKGHQFYHMSEMELYHIKLEIVDPESADQDS